MSRGNIKLSRRKLTWGLVAFLAIQLGIGVITDQDAVRVRDPDYAYRENQLRLLRSAYPDRRTVLLVGTSRTLMGVDAGGLTKTSSNLFYNFGMPAAGPPRQLVTWRRLLASGLKPDAIAVEVMPALLTHDGQRLFENQWSDPARLSFDEMSGVLPTYTRPSRSALRWGLARVAPLVRYSPNCYREYFSGSDNYLAGLPVDFPSDPFGWRQGFSVLSWNTPLRERYTQMLVRQYEKALTDTRPAPGEPLLEVLLKEIKAADVPVVVYVMPEASAFRTRAANLEPVIPRVAALCERQGVRFVDLRADMPDDAFWDGHHLHPETALHFTGRFSSHVLQHLTRPGNSWTLKTLPLSVSSQ